jgi:hypothetical protein
MRTRFLLLLVWGLTSVAPSTALAQGGRKQVSCDVAIVGGGAAGLHTAFRLGPQLHGNVCLFEKESQLGGRIRDIAKDPGGPVYGTGALRVMETQDVVFALAAELGITLQAVPYQDDRINARGMFAGDSDTLRALAYPLSAGGEGALYDSLMSNPNRATDVTKYPDYRSYVRNVVGVESYQFLTDVFRFRGDFTYPLSAKGYLEFLDEDWNVCCTPSYPVGGMSEFIRRMEQKAVTDGVRIFKSQPALEISGGRARASKYVITTPDYVATANRLVIAVDAAALQYIGGNVVEAILSQPQYKDLVPVKVAVVTQWWPDAWWEGAVPGKNIRRAWTTEQCLNFIEIPTDNYSQAQKVTRSVYDDDLQCVNFWEITAKRGIPAVEAEIKRGLQYLFPGATIPSPLKTDVQIWPAAWYFLKAGSPYSNDDIGVWALTPIANESIVLVGESYNPQRATWSDGAYKSSINALNSFYGFSLPGQTYSVSGTVAPVSKAKSVPRRNGTSR